MILERYIELGAVTDNVPAIQSLISRSSTPATLKLSRVAEAVWAGILSKAKLIAQIKGIRKSLKELDTMPCENVVNIAEPSLCSNRIYSEKKLLP